MEAVSFSEGKYEVVRVPIPTPGAGEALLKMEIAGLCSTDVELLRGYKSFSGVPGHEAVAIVERVGSTTTGSESDAELVGRRVVVEINRGCGKCSACLRDGSARHCEASRKVLGIAGWNGAFAEYFIAPISNLVFVPVCIPSKVAVFAEPLAAALRPTQQLHITSRDRIAVVGDGKLGLLCALALQIYSPHVFLIGRHVSEGLAARLKLVALNVRQGAIFQRGCCEFALPETLDPKAEGFCWPDVIRSTFGAFDIVADASGSPSGFELAMGIVRSGGCIVLKSTTAGASTPVALTDLVVREVKVLGSRCGDMCHAIRLLAQGRFPVEQLVDSTYSLEDFGAAFQRATTPGVLKVLLKPSR